MKLKSLIHVLPLLVVFGCGGGGGDNAPAPPDPAKNALASGTVGLPGSVVDNIGTITVYWVETDSEGLSSYVMRRNSGSGWSDQVTIVSDIDVRTKLSLYADDGKLWAAWNIPKPGSFNGHDIYVSSYTTTGGWSLADPVADISTQVEEIHIVADNSGMITTAWTQSATPTGGYFSLWTSQYADASWSTPEERELDIYDTKNIHMFADKSGAVFMAWEQGNQLYYARFDTTWTLRQPLAAGAANLHAAGNAAGQIALTWKSASQIYAGFFSADTGLETADQLTNDAVPPTVRSGPFVSINAGADVMVLWQSQTDDPLHDKVETTHKQFGQDWSGRLPVLDNLFFDNTQNIFIDNNLHGISVRRKGNSDVVYYRFQKDSNWSEEALLYHSTDVLFPPAMAVNAAGQGVITWKETVGSRDYIQVRLLPLL